MISASNAIASQVRSKATELSVNDLKIDQSDAEKIASVGMGSAEGRKALLDIVTNGLTVKAGGQQMKVQITPEAKGTLEAYGLFPMPAGVSDHRLAPLFAQMNQPSESWELSGTHPSKSHGLPIPNEMLYWNGRLGIKYNTFDNVAMVNKLLAGSGYSPMTTTVNGQQKAIGQVWFNDFQDTSYAPYKELILGVVAVPNGSPNQNMKWANGASSKSAADAPDAKIFTVKLWLSDQRPIDGGREELNCDKDSGTFDFQIDPAKALASFEATDKNKQNIVSTSIFTVPPPAQAQAAGAAYYAASQASGFALPASSHGVFPVVSRLSDESLAKPNGAPVTLAGPHYSGSQVHGTEWQYDADIGNAQFSLVDPADKSRQLDFNEGSEWGALWKSLGVTVTAEAYTGTVQGRIRNPVETTAWQKAHK